MDASGGQGHGGAASALVPTMQAASLGMCSTKKNINNNRDMSLRVFVKVSSMLFWWFYSFGLIFMKNRQKIVDNDVVIIYGTPPSIPLDYILFQN